MKVLLGPNLELIAIGLGAAVTARGAAILRTEKLRRWWRFGAGDMTKDQRRNKRG